MRIIAPALHRVLDFITVIAFALAPIVLGLVGVPAILSYVLAVVHLTLTLLTRFPEGSKRPVPLLVHGAIEGVVSVALIFVPLIGTWTGAARMFYLAAGLVILIVWFFSDYRAPGFSEA